MRIERMPEKQVETKHSPRKPEKREAPGKSVEAFVVLGIEAQSKALARWSLSPTPLPPLEGTLPEVAEVLSQIEIVDPNIKKRIKEISKKDKGMTKDDMAFTASVALAKARVVEDEGSLTLKEEKRLKKFKDTVLKGVGETIAKVGGKKALPIAAALSLSLTACGTAVTPKTPEDIQGVEPVATEVVESPTPFQSETTTPTIEPTPTTEPTPTIEPINVIGDVEVSGVGEFKLVDTNEGQLLEGFEDPLQMGWGQTVDGKWVIYDKDSGFAVETVDKEYMERLNIFPEYHNEDKYTNTTAIEIRYYLAKGFFVGFVDPEDIEITVNDEGETYPFGAIRVFVPRGNSGIILEALVYMDFGYDTESPYNGKGFAQAGGLPGISKKEVSVKDMLALLKTGDLLMLSIPHQGDLLQRSPPDSEKVETDDGYRIFVLFRQKYANLALEAEDLFLGGKSTIITVGPTHGVNVFPAP
jgi:hypothetical protein